MKVVVLVPHADDEVLGFGGVIQKHVLCGDTVKVLFAEEVDKSNNRYDIQSLCAVKASQILGYEYTFLGIPSKELLQINDDCISFIEDTLSELSPNVLYIPSEFDTHQDHQALFKVTRISTRMYGKAPIKRVMCGEIISSSECSVSLAQRFEPNFYEILSEDQVKQKQNAIACYWNELRRFPHPRSLEGIQIYAQKRGMECGAMYAEAFQCLRNIV
jgi:LmbE family N-acetylglucosaminyl deacetylase